MTCKTNISAFDIGCDLRATRCGSNAQSTHSCLGDVHLFPAGEQRLPVHPPPHNYDCLSSGEEDFISLCKLPSRPKAALPDRLTQIPPSCPSFGPLIVAVSSSQLPRSPEQLQGGRDIFCRCDSRAQGVNQDTWTWPPLRT